jgi:hypothetical protein
MKITDPSENETLFNLMKAENSKLEHTTTFGVLGTQKAREAGEYDYDRGDNIEHSGVTELGDGTVVYNATLFR